MPLHPPDATALLAAVGLLIGASFLLNMSVSRLSRVLADFRAIDEAFLGHRGLETRRYEKAIDDQRRRALLIQRATHVFAIAMLVLCVALTVAVLAPLTSTRPTPLVAPLAVVGLIAIAAGLLLVLRELHLAVHQHPRPSCGVDRRQRPWLRQS